MITYKIGTHYITSKCIEFGGEIYKGEDAYTITIEDKKFIFQYYDSQEDEYYSMLGKLEKKLEKCYSENKTFINLGKMIKETCWEDNLDYLGYDVVKIKR